MTKAPGTAVQAFSKELASRSKQFESVLPAHIKPQKFLRTVVGAVQQNRDILNADRESVFAACARAAQCGLIVDGKEAAIVTFGKQAAFMPMYGGILKMLRNSGQLSTITAQEVREKDQFSYNPGTGVLHHNPDWFGDRGELVGVYALAILKDGSRQVEIMSLADIEKVRAVSKSKNSGPWKDWYERMALKSVIRRIANLLPSSADVDQMMDFDSETYDLEDPESVTASDTPAPASTADINADLALDDTDGDVIEGEIVDERNPPPAGEDEDPI